MSLRSSSNLKSRRQSVNFNARPALIKFLSGPKLLLAADAIIFTLIVIFPFVMGGREAWGHRILITLALALGFAWSLHKVQTGGRLVLLAVEPLIIAGLLLVWFQTLPLSPEILSRISPEYERLLPGWASTQLAQSQQSTAAAWQTTSLLPTETRHAFLMLLSYGVIAVVVAQRMATEADCHHMLKLVGISGILMAVFACIQLTTSNDQFFWFYRQPYTGTREILKGAFTNRNHFAQFLALSIGPLIWWMMASRTKKPDAIRQLKGLGPATSNHSRFDNLVDAKMMMMICAAGGVVVSIMLSLSRGGMMAASLACVVCLASLWKSGCMSAPITVVIIGVGGIAIAGIMIVGKGKIEDRIDQLASADAESLDPGNARRAIWKADSLVVKAFPLLGCGVGSHRYIYPVYMQDLVNFRGTIFSHAESSYVHLTTETGLVGLALVALGVFFVNGRILWHLLKRTDPERIAALAAVMASLAAGIFHAAVDFIWYVPAIVVVTIVLGVAGLRLCTGFRAELGIPFPRVGWIVTALACLFVLCRVQPDLEQRVAGERCWNAYKNTSNDLITKAENAAEMSDQVDTTEEETLKDTPTENTNTIAAEQDADNVASYYQTETNESNLRELATRINLLMKAAKTDPQHIDTLQELSLLSLKMFQLQQRISDNPLSEIQIRDAAMANFSSTREMHGWLKKAFGRKMKLLMLSDQTARRALALCPVKGEAYMILLHTNFLTDAQDKNRESLINQALLAGGNDPYVRYFVGDCLLTEGKAEAAIEQWQYVFHSSPEFRTEVCRNLSRQLPVDFVITTFKPTDDELDEVLTAFMETGRKEEIEKLLYVITEATQKVLSAVQDSHNKSDAGRSTASKDTGPYVNLLMAGNKAAHALELYQQSETMLELAIKCDETSYWPHYALGLLFLKQERFAEASKMFEWCYEQNPGDINLEEQVVESRRRAIRKRTDVQAASYGESQTPRKF